MEIITTDEKMAKFISVIITGMIAELTGESITGDDLLSIKDSLIIDINSSYSKTDTIFKELLTSSINNN